MEFRLYFEIHERGLISCLRSENIEFVAVLVLDDNYCYMDFKCSMIFTRCVWITIIVYWATTLLINFFQDHLPCQWEENK